MTIRFVFVLFLSLPLVSFADSEKHIVVYHDADYSLHGSSAQAMKMGFLTALDEVDNKVQGFDIVFKEANHRGNIKRSLVNMKQFITDDKALFILGGLHSPPYIKNRSFINENEIPLLVPWAAGGPITRHPSEHNYVFRLSVDDTVAGIRISDFALNQLSCRNPHLLLENTPWGKSNQKTMSGYLKEKVPFDVTWFDWNTKQNAARIILRNILSSGFDCLFLVANYNESGQFVNAMMSMEAEKRIPIVSHWGVTGGDVDKLFTKQIREAISFNFIQSCYSISSSKQSDFQLSVLARAKKLFPDKMAKPGRVKAPAGFVHAYDLGKLAIAALNQIQLTGEVKKDRQLLKESLEALKAPVQGLIKVYNKPFSSWSEQQPDAHEALRLENFCMAGFGLHNTINVVPNLRE